MSVNIACSSPDCINPVIGQCTGYKKTCGKYYCREHSFDTLCGDCAKQKKADEHAELIYKEYLALAEKLTNEPVSVPKFDFPAKRFVKPAFWAFLIGGVLLVFLSLIGLVVGNLTDTNSLPPILIIIYTLLFLGLMVITVLPLVLIPLYILQDLSWTADEKKKIISAKAVEIEKEKPGFIQFWNEWSKRKQEEQAEKSRQALMGVLAVAGVIAAGVVGTALSESEYDRTRRAVRDEINSR